jgi:hypothetical protein
MAIGDSSGGIFVRLSDASGGPEVGASIEVAGSLAAPYGQLEIRQIEWLVLGPGDGPPAPRQLGLAEIGEQSEGSLVTVAGRVDSVQTSDGRLSLTVSDGSLVVRVLAGPAVGVPRADVSRGQAVRLTGIVGQRATASGRLDGYRLLPRSRADLALDPAAGTPSPSPASATKLVLGSLAGAIAARGGLLDVEATVTAPAGLFDWGGRTAVVDDGTGALAVLLPDAGNGALVQVGSRVHVAGKVGAYRGGLRVVASLFEPVGDAGAVEPREVTVVGPEVEWQLVRVSGRLDRVIRIGARWRADLSVAGRSIAVLGQLLPRSRLDLRLGPGSAQAAAALASGGPPVLPGMSGTAVPIELASLAENTGRTVVATGLVVGAQDGTATLDDGTSRARIGGEAAADAIALLEPEDAVEVTGTVEVDADGPWIRVDPDRIVVLSGIDDESSGDPAGQATGAPSAEVIGSGMSEPVSSGAGPMSHGMIAGAADLPNPTLPIVAVLAAVGIGLVAVAASPRLRRRLRRLHRPAARGHEEPLKRPSRCREAP